MSIKNPSIFQIIKLCLKKNYFAQFTYVLLVLIDLYFYSKMTIVYKLEVSVRKSQFSLFSLYTGQVTSSDGGES